MSTFGTYDTSVPSIQLEEGIYDAIIDSASVVFESPGVPKQTENGKNLVDVLFVIDGENKPRRRYSISFGQNRSNGQWSAFAKLLEAATGVKVGDKAQRAISDEDLRGKRVRVMLRENDRGYMDVTDVLPAVRKAQPAARRPEPVHDDAGAFGDEDFAGLERR